MSQSKGALSAVRIVDLTTANSIYGVKLMADLGADVVRVELVSGDPLRSRGPFDKKSGESLWFAFFASSRRFLQLDESVDSAREQLSQLMRSSNVVVLDADSTIAPYCDLERACAENESLVVVDCSSFGKEGPWRDYNAPELVAAALAGQAATTGDVDTEPLKLFGDLNFMLSGCYAAIGALSGLYHARAQKTGQKIEIPTHECIASCLEHVFMWYFGNEYLGHAKARALERRGSLHWTDLYHVMQARNGSVMVTPAPSVDSQLAWMIEEGRFDNLLDPEFQEPGAHRKYLMRMMDLLREWLASVDGKEIFEAAQERHMPYGLVQTVPMLAEDQQLEARNWWQEYQIGDRKVQGVGAPFAFTKTPSRVAKSEWQKAASTDVLSMIGWGEDS